MIDKFNMGMINSTRFIPIDQEELTALELMGKNMAKTNEVVEEVNKQRVDLDGKMGVTQYELDIEKRKLYPNADFRGSWFGITSPTLADPGIANVVDRIVTNQPVNVLDYCKNELDNGLDCGAQFKVAIDQAVTLGINSLYIPKSTKPYMIETTIKIPSNFTVKSDGAILKAVMKTGDDLFSYPSTIFYSDSTENIVIDGVTFHGNQGVGSFGESETSFSNMVLFENVTGLTFTNCQILNGGSSWTIDKTRFTAFGCVLFKSCTNVVFSNNTYKFSRIEGVMFERCQKVVIDNFVAENTKVWTQLHCWYCDDVTIKNCTFNDGNVSPGSTMNVHSSNMVITNNVIVGGKGIDISNEAPESFVCRNVTITNNHVETEHYGIYLPHTTNLDIKNIMIKDNYFKSVLHGVQLSRAYNVDITGNQITVGTGAYGVNIGNGENCNVLNNQVNSPSTGIHFGTALNCNIKSNIVRASLNGVQLNINGNYVIISENQFIGTERGFQCMVNTSGTTPIYFHNITFKNNYVEAKPLTNVLSYNGGSSGVHFHVRSTAPTNGQITNILIDSNVMKGCEGSYIFITLDAALNLIRNFDITNNTFESTANGCDRAVSLVGAQNVKFMGNNTFDTLKPITFAKGIGSLIIVNNQLNFVKTNMTVNGYAIQENTGRAVIQGNICSKTNYTHFTDNDKTNTFTEKVLTGNLPGTYGGGLNG